MRFGGGRSHGTAHRRVSEPVPPLRETIGHSGWKCPWSRELLVAQHALEFGQQGVARKAQDFPMSVTPKIS